MKIKQVLAIVFKGGTVPSRFHDIYTEWIEFVRIYLFCCDRETGAISVSPLEVMDWPYRFFLNISFVAHISSERKKVMDKNKGKRGRR
jgi:hypothetical protein